jgi:hypothetical protein
MVRKKTDWYYTKKTEQSIVTSKQFRVIRGQHLHADILMH